MADELTVDVRKRYAGGPEIAAALRLPLGEPSVMVLFGPAGRQARPCRAIDPLRR